MENLYHIGRDKAKNEIYIIDDSVSLSHAQILIDENVDLGKIISHEKTPFFKSDTIKRFAKRHYNAEVNMLTNFEYHLNNPKILNLETCQANMRMPINLEKKMYKMYNNYKRYILK